MKKSTKYYNVTLTKIQLGFAVFPIENVTTQVQKIDILLFKIKKNRIPRSRLLKIIVKFVLVHSSIVPRRVGNIQNTILHELSSYITVPVTI